MTAADEINETYRQGYIEAEFLRRENARLRDVMRRFRDYVCTDKVSMGGAHHDPIWQEVAVAIAGDQKSA